MTKQLEMKLPMWGGKRKGAGRKPKGSRAGVPHVARKLPSRSPAHVTVKLAPGLPSLRSSRRFSVVRRALAAAKERFGFRIIHFTVQGNHLHLLVEAEDATALSRGMKGLQVRIARGLNAVDGRRGAVFADRFHSRALRSPPEVAYVLRYVLQNAERHGQATGLDPYTSAGIARPEEVTAEPRTWLVRVVLERDAVGGVTSGLIGAGQEVTWRARHFLVWQELTSRIVGFDPPRWFRDAQLRGAFRRFDHDHFFEPAEGGGTVMRDIFDYQAPLGRLGWIAERILLDAHFRRFLMVRNAEIKAVAESADWKRYLRAGATAKAPDRRP